VKKKDLILIIIIIAAAALMYFFISKARAVQGDILRITVDGEVYGEYPLEDACTIEIETELGKNVLTIENGSAHMEEADCPDGYCIEQGVIDHNSETIVCLPHKLVAEVIAEETGDEPQVDIIR
jgi:hypothetical protein